MPPRWPRKPDPQDPAYRRLEDRINFAVHIAFFAAVNSGLWFFKLFWQQDWPGLIWLSGAWGLLLFSHGVYVFKVAQYGPSAHKGLGS